MFLTRETLIRSFKMMLTLTLAVLAALLLWHLYNYYTYAPQTRDGKLRADIVPIATDEAGRVDSVVVEDGEMVEKGQLLFTIDKVRLRNALAQAEAAIATARATLRSAEREARRYAALDGVVSAQDRDTRQAEAEEARARFTQAIADRDLARINLERAEVRSPVNGIVTNFQLRPGVYANAGQPVMSLVDRDSYYVSGYFEETKLAQIHQGLHARIRLMGDDRLLEGHVVGVASAINDSERSTDAGTLLADVKPTFSWVRLAQRVPVRIAIDRVPEGVMLVAGRTVTVTLDGADKEIYPETFHE